jgi:murein L,D-transpeptidase YcbB/YkuD
MNSKRFLISLSFFSVCIFLATISQAAKYEINTEEENSHAFPIYQSKRKIIHELKKAIKNYKRIEKQGWPKIDKGKKLELGSQELRVLQLRERLWVSTDFTNSRDLKNDLFDEGLEEAVKKFQLRHGLNPDGVVGEGTIKLLNIPLVEKIKQMEINVQRLKNSQDDFDGNYLFINIPDYRLSVIEENSPAMIMRVIVGRTRDKTPIFSDEMEYVVLSPKWHVPQSIAVKELAPKMKKDPDYLAKRNYKVVPTKKSTDGEAFDAAKIDWENVNHKNINFRLVKAAGWGNSLGFYKFIFPNRYSVYLHDTPTRYLFKKDYRALSHGCVRVSRPLDLAEYLLENEGWQRDAIKKTSRQGREKYVHFKEHIPIHLRYFTAWVDEKGRPNFRKDIYRRDRLIDIKVDSK